MHFWLRMRLRSLSHVRKHLQCQFKNRVPFSPFSPSATASEEGLKLLLVSEAFSLRLPHRPCVVV